MSAAKSILVAAVLSMGFIGAASARDAVFTVKLEQPVAEQTRVIAQNTIWTCNGDTCRARPDHAATVRSCRQFVRELGARVTAYGPEGDELTAEQLARCNGDSSTEQARN
jgi:predicted TIM-barrel enzyme